MSTIPRNCNEDTLSINHTKSEENVSYLLSDSLAAGYVSGRVQTGLEDELPKATNLVVFEHNLHSAIDGFRRSSDRDAVLGDSLPDVGGGLQQFF